VPLRKRHFEKRGLSVDSKVFKGMKRDFLSVSALSKLENEKIVKHLVDSVKDICTEGFATKR
jgi:hypothetical protein